MSAPAAHATIGGVNAPAAGRLAAYDRWLDRPGPRALLLRWLMGEQGAFLANGPALRLPRELGLDGGERTLDVGCGRASLLRLLDRQLPFARDPVGLDGSRAALAAAAADEARAGRRRALVRGEASALPFADASFLLVLCGHLVKHLDDDALRDLLDEVRRVLAPGGLALLWEFAPTGRRLLDAWNRRCLGFGGSAPRLRSTRTLLRFAREAGFPFAAAAGLRPFLFPPIPRASVLLGRPPEDGPAPQPAPSRR